MRALLLILLLAFGCGNAEMDSQPDNTSSQIVQAPSCPPCDDRNNCTSDSCSADTSYACVYTPIKPCCGDGLCETGEEQCSDCPVCPAAACQRAYYNYQTQECMVDDVSPCCGNALCEEGEIGLCDDCPKCETTDSCKTAKYSYEAQTCTIKPLVPCCGNGICDRGEGCNSCEKDCGDCDDEDESGLSEFPDFLDDGTIIVVGDEAKSQDSLTASMLATWLLTEGVETDSGIYSMLDKKVLDSEDLIVLGRPCENKAWEEYLGVECGSDDYFEPGTAMIKLDYDSGREVIFIGGATPEETERAAEYLTTKSLSGTEIELK